MDHAEACEEAGATFPAMIWMVMDPYLNQNSGRHIRHRVVHNNVEFDQTHLITVSTVGVNAHR